MNYSKNLQGQFKKSKWRIFFGTAMVLMAMVYLISLYFNTQFTHWNYLIAALFLVNGIYSIAAGRGYMLGKSSHVKIDEQTIIIKTIGKEKKAFWKDIESIDFKDGKLSIFPEDKKFQIVSLKYLNEDCALEIRNEIIKAANQKGIKVINE